MHDQLTDRQQQILDFISQSINGRGFPPTLREIGEHFGIKSTNGVNDHLKALEKKGFLRREDLKSRAMRPVAMDNVVSLAEPVFAPKSVKSREGEGYLLGVAYNLDQMGFYPRTHAVFAAMADKDIAGMVRAIGHLVDAWYLCDLPLERAASADAVQRICQATMPGLHKGDTPCKVYPGPVQAVRAAFDAADVFRWCKARLESSFVPTYLENALGAVPLVSGATLSSVHVAEGVKKILAIHARYLPTGG
mgnify:CR=1 FL=1